MDDRKLLQVRLEPAFFERLEVWRHEHRFNTRTQAVRALLELGLAAKTKGRKADGPVGKKPKP